MLKALTPRFSSNITPTIALSSDTSAPAHPKYIAAVAQSVESYTKTYSVDETTAKAERQLKEIFGPQTQAFFLNNGTSVNTALLKSVMNSTDAVICTDIAHMAHRAAGSLESNIGCKVIQVSHQQGKLTVESLKRAIEQHDSTGTSHKNQELVVSISQPTETGALYKPEEIKAIADFVHGRNMLLHMDGSRLFHAASALKTNLKSLTTDLGIDMLYLGGYKNNAIISEAMLFLPPFYKNYPNALRSRNFTENSNIELQPERFRRYVKILIKQLGNLNAKSAFLAQQFMTAFQDNLGMKTATAANENAKRLASAILKVPGIALYQPTETNVIMLTMPKAMKKHLDERFSYIKTLIPHIPGKPNHVGIRLMTHGLTQQEELNSLIQWLEEHNAQKAVERVA